MKVMKQVKKDKQNINKNSLSAFATQPISQADKKQKHTNVALPDDENVTAERNWCNENEK